MTYSSIILADTPIAYYRLNEASGLVAHDLSGNGNDGILSGVTAYSQTGAISSESDTSLLFGAAGTLSLPYTLNPSSWSELSVELWIQLTGGWQYVVATADRSRGALYLNGFPYTGGSGDVVVIDQYLSFIGSVTAGGNLDEAGIYNYQLSESQVLSHYNYLAFTHGIGKRKTYAFYQSGVIPGISGYFSGNQNVVIDLDTMTVAGVFPLPDSLI